MLKGLKNTLRKMKEKRVCFVEPPYGRFAERLDAPFALLYLAGVAENFGWKAQIAEMHNLNDKLPKADIYAVTSSSPQFPETVKLEERLGLEFPDAIRILGGNHLSAVPADLFKTNFNVGVIGEGEIALGLILTNDLKWMRSATCVGLHGEPVDDLDAIPFPARHLVDWSKYKRGIYWGKELLAPAVSMITSRGCPNACVFCGSRCVFGRRTRFRSIGNVVAEIKQVKETLGIRGINFHDDTMTLNRTRTLEMCRELQKLDIVWRCLTRADTVDEELLTEMQKAGCKEIILGIESGNDAVLKRLNKGTTAKQNLKAMKMIKKAGIQLKAGIIVGSPSETKEAVEDTKKLLRACPPDFWNVSVLTPFPGSDLWNNPEKYGLKILTRDLSQYAMVTGNNFKGIVVSETKEMKKEDIEQARDSLIELLKELSPP